MADSSRSLQRAAPIALPVAALVVLLDQLTKHWALNALDTGPKHVVWTLRFNLAFNSGMAFSRGRGLGPVIGALALVVVVACAVLLVDWIGAHPHGRWDAWAIWNLRAKFLATPSDRWRDAFDPVVSWSHPDYPLLLPLAVSYTHLTLPTILRV